MAYNTDKLYNRAIEVIKGQRLFFVDDVVAYLGISRTTFYDHFPVESDKMNNIKRLLNENRMNVKVSIRSKLHKSKSTTGLIALYKLICSDSERKKLSQSNVDVTTDGESFKEMPKTIDELYGRDTEDNSESEA